MILAFDIGVKNLAYCLLNDNGKIENWENINLIDDKNCFQDRICENCVCKAIYLSDDKNYCGKHINGSITDKIKCEKCKQKPKFYLENKYYCKKHNINNTKNIIEYINKEKEKYLNLNGIKKCNHKIKGRNCKLKVTSIMNNNYYCKKHNINGESLIKQNANKIKPSELCLKVGNELEKREYLMEATEIYIENQGLQYTF